MRHLKAHRKLGRTTEHRMSLLRNLATSLINARDERLVTTVPKAKELRSFVERAITLSRHAHAMTGDDANIKRVHLRRQAAAFFHAGNHGAAQLTSRKSTSGANRPPRTAGVAAVKRLFDELGARYAERNGGYTRIIRLGRRDGDNAELAIIELVGNPFEVRQAANNSTNATNARTAGSAPAASNRRRKRGEQPQQPNKQAE